MRGGTRVEEITPNEAETMSAVGLLKFTLLNTLKASPRSTTLIRSVIGIPLCRAKSVWKKPGPVNRQPSTTTQETELPLKLYGTTLSTGERRVSAAIIEVREGATKTGTYYPGNEVIDRVFLKEVHPQEVILDNRRSNTTESLKIVWASAPSGPSGLTPAGRQPVKQVAPASAGDSARAPVASRARQAAITDASRSFGPISMCTVVGRGSRLGSAGSATSADSPMTVSAIPSG